MTATPQTWTGKAARALASWADRPLALFLLLWTLNSLARPYAGFIHDARLYAVQVLNQVEAGAFADDLFLRYGSQDQFSLFSRLVAPVAAGLGLETAFFLLYLASNALFLFALMRLTLALVSDRALAVASLIFLAVAPLHFGGLCVFQVHETFLTPRILANALTLLALEQVLRQRFGRAALFLLAGVAMHPLMAFGGCLIWLGALAVRWLPLRTLALGLAGLAVAGVAIVANPAWGGALFGVMDEPWRDMVRRASAYNFPDEWSVRDWLGVAAALAIVAGAGLELRREQPWPARVFLVSAAAGLLGLLGTVAASCLPYALLFQGQSYRVLWILALLKVPLGLGLAARWLTQGQGVPLALAILFYLALTGFTWLELVVPLFFCPFFVLAFRGLESQPRQADWLARSGLASLACGFAGWALYKWFVIWVHRETLAANVDALDIARLLLDHVGPVGWLLLTTAVLVRWQMARLRLLAAPALALLVNIAYFALPFNAAYRAHCTRDFGDLDFVSAHLAKHQTPGRPLTIYSALGRADYVWVDLRAKSYYDWAQIVGVLFHRQTAVEGGRRALLVSRFEMHRMRTDPLASEEANQVAERLYQTDWDGPPPTREDLAKLLLENIDFAVLKQEFPDLVAAGNGRVFIYDCRQLQRLADVRGPGEKNINPLHSKDLAP